MTFYKLSKKQRLVFKWWAAKSGGKYKSILCDGAIRSGKTICMITSYILWAMTKFSGATFGICGKTVQSVERNIILPLMSIADLRKIYKLQYRRSDHRLTVSAKGRQNYFYLFGGKDESSYMLIQGLTLSGIFFDEVALMPRSFVEQGIGRTLSVPEARYWLNCNPENPSHFIKTEWVDDADSANEKRILHLHFLMEDNPVITKEQIEEAKRQFKGVFYDRYILGLWTKPEGLVYPNFTKKNIVPKFGLRDRSKARFYISCDYGTLNAFSLGLWAIMKLPRGLTAFRVAEYYHSGRATGKLMTDAEYYEQLLKLSSGFSIEGICVDPSAASFITLIRKQDKFKVYSAKNDVINGIRYTSSLISDERLLICENCKEIIREFGLYVWDEKATSDTVKKTDDHTMDDMRYFCETFFKTLTGIGASVADPFEDFVKGGWE